MTNRTRILAALGSFLALSAALAIFALPSYTTALTLLVVIFTGISITALLVSPASDKKHEDGASVLSSHTLSVQQPSTDSDLRAELERHKALEQQLTLAKQEAEAATMAKGEFLATMSHEIRTPLNGVIPLLDLLLSTPLTPDQRDYLGTAYNSACQLLRIVDDILDYSKLDANKLELENVSLNLKEIATGVLRLLEKSAEAKNLRLGLAIDPKVRISMRGDPVRLRQVLTNLVSNAIKFTERGSVSVHILRVSETRTRTQLRFEVRDTGIGISEEAIAQLFNAFSQADASTTRTFGGTGLGLAICKRIVTLMGGTVGVESTLGRGSNFWFEVSLDKAIGDIEGGVRSDNENIRALLLTSNSKQHHRFTQAFDQWGVNFVHASNTHEALQRLRGHQGHGKKPLNLVLVDVSSVPTTLLALYRSLARESGKQPLLQIYLRGEESIPSELANAKNVHIVARDSDTRELHSRIVTLLATASENDETTSETQGISTPQEVLISPLAKLSESSEIATEQSRSIAPAMPVKTTSKQLLNTPTESVQGNVLLVEDNPVNLQVAQRLLSLAGIPFDSAENGKEALDKMNTESYSVVLMDCQMPVMDGYTATRERRKHEKALGLKRLPIIAMTANAMLGDREKCLDAGMDDYLTKPLNRSLLESTTRNWMQLSAHAKSEKNAPLMSSESAIPVTSTIPTPSKTPTTPITAPASMPSPTPRTTPIATAAPRMAASNPASQPQAAKPTPPASNAPIATAPLPPPLNTEILQELQEIMGAEFSSLINVFLEDAPAIIARIMSAAAQNDTASMVTSAHTLKSTSANLGALTLSRLARSMEIEGKQGAVKNPTQRALALAAEFDRVATAMKKAYL